MLSEPKKAVQIPMKQTSAVDEYECFSEEVNPTDKEDVRSEKNTKIAV